MSAICEICGREFKTTQGLRGHKTFVHQIISPSEPPARLATEQHLSKLDDRLQKLESMTGLKEPGALDRLLGTDKPLTEQVSELTDQLNGLAEQLELSRVTKAVWDEHEADHKRQLEQLRSEWENAYNKLVGIINRNGELAKKSFSITEDGARATNRQINDLMKLVHQLEERVESRVALENQLYGKVNAMEQKLSRFESELGVMRNLTRRQPTGKLVSVRLNDGRDHQFKAYRSPEGLTRPYRQSRDLLLGDRWIDLAEPED
jgi:DNA repair exonuclease SbcCD ATPase subunit